jgi:hypothetical protein
MEKIGSFALKMDRNAQVIGILSRYSGVWNKVSKFQAAVDQLNSYQGKLVELYAMLVNTDLSAIENAKQDRRKELQDRTMTVVRIMQVFAHDKKKGKLQRKLYHLTNKYVESCLDLELLAISREIWHIANKSGGYSLTFKSKMAAALDPENGKATSKFEKEFGLIPEMIKNLEEAILNFIKAVIPYKEEMMEKENVATKMKEINKKTKKLLANKIDGHVLSFEVQNPGFYKEYTDLREDHSDTHVKETTEQKNDFQGLLPGEIEIVKTKPKLKPKKPQKANP